MRAALLQYSPPELPTYPSSLAKQVGKGKPNLLEESRTDFMNTYIRHKNEFQAHKGSVLAHNAEGEPFEDEWRCLQEPSYFCPETVHRSAEGPGPGEDMGIPTPLAENTDSCHDIYRPGFPFAFEGQCYFGGLEDDDTRYQCDNFGVHPLSIDEFQYMVTARHRIDSKISQGLYTSYSVYPGVSKQWDDHDFSQGVYNSRTNSYGAHRAEHTLRAAFAPRARVRPFLSPATLPSPR